MPSTLLERFALLCLVLGPVACGDDGEETDGTDTGSSDENSATDTDSSVTDPSDTSAATDPDSSSTDPDATSTDATSATETSSTNATESSSSTDPTGETTEGSTTDTDTGAGDCVVLTRTGDFTLIGGGDASFYLVAADFVGDPLVDDTLRLEFWFDAGAGTFDLASPNVNDNYATCEQCVRLFEDGDDLANARQYFQLEGNIEVTEDPALGLLSATLNSVRLIEVTIGVGAVSTPVPDGACVDIVDRNVATPPVPPEWTCDPAWFVDVDCHCGCAVLDPACLDETVDSCDFCDDPGSCSTEACPGMIDPIDNAACG